eukprot:CAMPEP_0118946962 /NCGR_PEP_ID=MMETSP1169-20130426/45171_1 /TAXON_ID=36882 /ORGANISM="Pyramimonas obovata, Strain CCMP722" /LENGTH=66 /DNA_ID=CAMNT_0006893081 /DNA_START=83 /DNA_END=279 /DNA_ORIENTATION=-
MPKKKGGRKGADDLDDEFALPDEGADNAAPDPSEMKKGGKKDKKGKKGKRDIDEEEEFGVPKQAEG